MCFSVIHKFYFYSAYPFELKNTTSRVYDLTIICLNGIEINNYVDLLTIVQKLSFPFLPPMCNMALFVISWQYHSTTDLKRICDVTWSVDTFIYLLDSTYCGKQIHFWWNITVLNDNTDNCKQFYPNVKLNKLCLYGI